MSALVSNLLLELKAGRHWGDQWLWEIDDVPVNLTGCTGKLQFRRTPDASEVLLEVSTANGRMTLGPLTGKISVNVPASAIAAISGRGYFDVEIIMSDGKPWDFIEGTFVITPEVTR